MEISLETYGFNKDGEGIGHLKWLCDLCCLDIFIYLLATLQSPQEKKWKCDSQELFERKLFVYFLLYYSKKRLFRIGFDPEIYFVAYDNLTLLGFLTTRTE